MKWRRVRAELIALAVGIALNVVVVVALTAPEPRSAAEEGFAQMSRDGKSVESWQYMANADRSCTGCHRVNSELSHPTCVTAPGDMPRSLPLDTRGQMHCQTCHVAWNEDGDHAASGQHPSLLRVSPSRRLCQICHVVNGALERRDIHGASLGRAHLDTPLANRAGMFDAETGQCLSCHDGVMKSVCEARSPSGPSIGFSHPLGQRYDRPSRSRTPLHPISRLAPTVRLFDGRLGCGSCHNPFSRRKHLLCVDIRDSRLCRTCHNL